MKWWVMPSTWGSILSDTANVYREDASENQLGKALGTRRKDVVIATKVLGRMGSGANDVGLSRKHVISQAEASLKRLNTDYIDLYQIHGFDALTPLEETLCPLNYLVQQGKVHYIGCSNLAAWQIVNARGISSEQNLERFVTALTTEYLQWMFELQASGRSPGTIRDFSHLMRNV